MGAVCLLYSPLYTAQSKTKFEVCMITVNESPVKAVFPAQTKEISPGPWEYLGFSDPPNFKLFRRPIWVNRDGTAVAYEQRSEPC